MSERLILELKSKFKNELKIEIEKNKDEYLTFNTETKKIIDDIKLTLMTLNYTKSEINDVLPNIIKEIKTKNFINSNDKNISFENILKFSMNYLDNKNSNIVR